MRRLYQKIYLTIIASLLLVVLVAGAVWRMGADRMPAAQAFEMAGELAAAALASASSASNSTIGHTRNPHARNASSSGPNCPNRWGSMPAPVL